MFYVSKISIACIDVKYFLLLFKRFACGSTPERLDQHSDLRQASIAITCSCIGNPVTTASPSLVM